MMPDAREFDVVAGKGEAMARLRPLERRELTAQGREVWDWYVGTRGYELKDNYRTLLHSPEAAKRFSELGEYLRFRCSVPPRLRQVAILATARSVDSHWVWTLHALLAPNDGVSREVIDSLGEGRVPVEGSLEEQTVAEFAFQLLREHRVSEEVFRRAQGVLGDGGVVDLSLLVGYYASMGLAMAAFEVRPEPEVESTLPALGG